MGQTENVNLRLSLSSYLKNVTGRPRHWTIVRERERDLSDLEVLSICSVVLYFTFFDLKLL